MSTDPSRSQEVIASYKRHKLARSTWHRIHDLIHEFDKDAAFDRKVALVGMVVIAALVAVSLVVLFNGSSTILS